MNAQVQGNADMISIEIDGVEMEAPKGSMIIEAADKAGIQIPRFCYHPKLSIAANCRMCLVDVEKAPKPLPACATPVMDGMKVFTRSRRAIDAQHGVMEFLLINHPLDCPICDQGGECELQDLAMGYGRSVSRFTERKRVVKDKNVGPLIKTDMTRCIHCTRCVRFLEEVAGTCEMGGVGRGDRLEITAGIESSIDSEVSGNIIDLCPVGALTNKPFRYSARAWELMAKPSVAMHDGTGSRLWYHTRRGRVMRAVPLDSEYSEHCWISDRDRYSHFGLYSEDRVTTPQVKRDGTWHSVSWAEAIDAAAGILRDAVTAGGDALGVLMSPSALNEEYFLAQRLARSLGCQNIDHRLRELDTSDDAGRPAAPVFEMSSSDVASADAILLVGSNIRSEAPTLGINIRKAQRGGAQVAVVNPVAWPMHFDLGAQHIVPAQQMVAELAGLASAVVGDSDVPEPLAGVMAGASADDSQRGIAEQLKQGERAVVVLGQWAATHPQAATLRQLAALIATNCGAALNIMGMGGNTVGAHRYGAVPHRGPGGAAMPAGLNAQAMLSEPRNAYLLWGFEPDFDSANPAATQAALAAADKVVAVVSYATENLREAADVLLPLAPVPESEGSMVSLNGDHLPVSAAGKLSGESRPGWKILRRLGEALDLEGFSQVGLAEIQSDMATAVESGSASTGPFELAEVKTDAALWRIGEVPGNAVDAMTRRAACLQESDAYPPRVLRINPVDAQRLALTDGGKALVKQGSGSAEMNVEVTAIVAPGSVWVPAASCITRELGAINGPVSVEVV